MCGCVCQLRPDVFINHASKKHFFLPGCQGSLTCIYDLQELLYKQDLCPNKLIIQVNFNKVCQLLDAAMCVLRALQLAVSETVTRSQPDAAPQRPHVKQGPATSCYALLD